MRGEERSGERMWKKKKKKKRRRKDNRSYGESNGSCDESNRVWGDCSCGKSCGKVKLELETASAMK
tara:strand:+ start:6789 stop:6986 length:198 start_codon:yes stop_codon:yes gene_type:complete